MKISPSCFAHFCRATSLAECTGGHCARLFFGFVCRFLSLSASLFYSLYTHFSIYIFMPVHLSLSFSLRLPELFSRRPLTKVCEWTKERMSDDKDGRARYVWFLCESRNAIVKRTANYLQRCFHVIYHLFFLFLPSNRWNVPTRFWYKERDEFTRMFRPETLSRMIRVKPVLF